MIDDRRSEREKPKMIYTDSKAIDELKWTKLLETKSFIDHDFETFQGVEITKHWASTIGMERPILVLEPKGLEMEMPSILTVDEVIQHCGADRMVDVIQVSTQTDIQMTLGAWGDYYKTPSEKRARIMNVISLEVGNTEWGNKMKRPKLVRDLDWIDLVWPRILKLKTLEYPKVL
jgi:hypothetical protein